LVESTTIHPVVSGLYKMDNIVNFACVKEWDTEFFIKYGQFKFLCESDLKKMDKFESVAYNGLGFFACRREVFDKLKYPFFYRPLEEIKDKDGNVVLVEMCSEDVAFCRNLTDQGIKIMVNKDIILGHEKTFAI
jgi:hypothetical protein